MAGLRNFEQRERNTEHRKRKKFIIIGCEGKNKTEKLYFKNFNNKKCIIKFSKGNHTDPVGIVEELINYIKNEIGYEENDKAYAVFDTDVGQNKQSQIEEAKKLARKNNIEIITSTPEFEIWFLLHFRFTTQAFSSNKSVEQELKKYITDYSKNENTYIKVNNLTDKAIKNSMKLEKTQYERGKPIDNENCNPYTGVYKIVEELLKRNNEV